MCPFDTGTELCRMPKRRAIATWLQMYKGNHTTQLLKHLLSSSVIGLLRIACASSVDLHHCLAGSKCHGVTARRKLCSPPLAGCSSCRHSSRFLSRPPPPPPHVRPRQRPAPRPPPYLSALSTSLGRPPYATTPPPEHRSFPRQRLGLETVMDNARQVIKTHYELSLIGLHDII